MLRSNKGISLLEAVMAIAVISIGILSIVTLFPLALRISRNAEQETIATNLMQAKAEELFSLGYDNIPIGTIEAKHRLSTDPNNPFYAYWRQTVSQYVNADLNYSAGATGIKKITITSYWISPRINIEKNDSLIILISQK